MAGRRAVITTAAVLAVLVGACSSSESPAPVDLDTTLPSTTEVALTPESLRDELIAAIAARDEAALRGLWPVLSWETIGRDVLSDFDAAPELGNCDRLSPVRASCFVFERDLPFVLGLTMEFESGAWSLATVSFDSTN